MFILLNLFLMVDNILCMYCSFVVFVLRLVRLFNKLIIGFIILRYGLIFVKSFFIVFLKFLLVMVCVSFMLVFILEFIKWFLVFVSMFFVISIIGIMYIINFI